MISTEQLLSALQREKLVSTPLLESLRKQIAQATTPITAAMIVKKLVEKQLLTPAQAQQLLGTTGAGQAARARRARRRRRAGRLRRHSTLVGHHPAAKSTPRPSAKPALHGAGGRGGTKPGTPIKTLASIAPAAATSPKLRDAAEAPVIKPPEESSSAAENTPGAKPGGAGTIGSVAGSFATIAPPAADDDYGLADEEPLPSEPKPSTAAAKAAFPAPAKPAPAAKAPAAPAVKPAACGRGLRQRPSQRQRLSPRRPPSPRQP